MKDSLLLTTGLDRGKRRLVVPLALWLVLQIPASAADITVSGGCSLADAITAANNNAPSGGCPAGAGADKLILTADVTLSEIDNTDLGASGLPVIDSTITVEGNGFEIERATGSDPFRIFTVNGFGNLALRHTTVSNGGGPGFTSGYGGGILVFGVATLAYSTVSGCSAKRGGGITASGTFLGLTYSTVSDNYAITRGGGIDSESGSTTLTNSTVSGNSTGFEYGGGIDVNYGNLTLSFSTLSGNTGSISGDAVLLSSLLANSDGANCSNGTITDFGGNLSSDGSCATIPGGLTGLSSSLADNGGPTRTHALLAGSNAIDNVGACMTSTDQRVYPRDDGSCDSGSFEYSAPVCTLLELEDDTISGAETYSCGEIHLGPNLAVVGPNGSLTVTADTEVVLHDDVSVLTDGKLTAGNAPNP